MRIVREKLPLRIVGYVLVLSVVLVFLLWMFYPGRLSYFLGRDRHVQSAFPSKSIARIIQEKKLSQPLKNPVLWVSKSTLTLTLFEGTTALKSYAIVMGKNYLEGDKEAEGDFRTPVGRYYIAEKRIEVPPDAFLGSRWLHISYPNQDDARNGLNKGIISPKEYSLIKKALDNHQVAPQKTPLGGEIGIHGGHTPSKNNHWTEGCIALFNRDIEELYKYVPVGTPVIIKP